MVSAISEISPKLNSKLINVNGYKSRSFGEFVDPLLICDVGQILAHKQMKVTTRPGLVIGPKKENLQGHLNSSTKVNLDRSMIETTTEVDFGDADARPALTPQVGFYFRKYMSRIWALVLKSFKVSLEGNFRPSARLEEVGEENPPVDSDMPDEELESNDSVTEFEKNLRELMPGL